MEFENLYHRPNKLVQTIKQLNKIVRVLFFWKRLNEEQLRYFYLIVFGIIVVLGPLVAGSLMQPAGAGAAWFDDNWLYRKAITVTVTSSSSDITNLQTLITVDANALGSTKLQTNCQDLRFTNASGKLLPYYIDSCTNSNASSKIWVLLDLVPKNTTTYTLFMYYGNPSAAAASSSTQFDNLVGLKGYWTMNDGGSSATATDSSVNGNSGNLSIGGGGTQTTNTQAWTNGASGKYGASINLDGNDDYVSVTNNSNMDATTNFTLELWVKINGLPASAGVLVSKHRQSTSPISGYNAYINSNGTITFQLRAGNACCQTLTTSTVLTTATWYHLTFTYDNVTMKVFINSVQDSVTQAATGTISSTQDLNISRDVNSPGSYLNAQFDDVKIYNTTRTAAQIITDYQSTYPLQTTAPATIVPTTSFATEENAPGPIGYWKFDEGQGTTASDATTNKNNGALSGTTVPTWQTEDQCISGKCLYFDGITSNVSVSNTVSGVQTIAFWVKPATSSASLVQLASGVDVKATSGTVGTDGITSPTVYVNAVANGTVTANTWNYVTVTTGSGITANSILLGKMQTGVLNGFMDEVKLYPTARSAAQVLIDYNSRSARKGAGDVLGANTKNNSALTNGLVGYWKMDDNVSGDAKSLVDASGNSKTGTTHYGANATGMDCTVAGKYGGGCSFDGTDDYAISTLDGTALTNATVSFWFNPTSNSGTTGIFQWANALSTGTPFILIQNAGGVLRFYVDSGYRDSSQVISTGTWYHAVVTLTNATTWKFYLNGSLLSTYTGGVTLQANAASVYFGNGYNGYFNGKIDEARVYNRALSPAEVSTLYNFAPGPVAYWKLDEGTGTTLNDISGNGNTETLSIGSSGTQTTSGQAWKVGKYGKGVSFDGTDDSAVSTSNIGITGAANRTVSLWVKPSALDDSNTTNPLLWWGAQSGGNLSLIGLGTRKVSVYGFSNDAVGTTTLLNNNWYHVAFTYDGTSIRIYVNGVLESKTDRTWNTTNSTVTLGYYSGWNAFYNGVMDDVKIYNYVRTAGQIIEDMNGGHPAGGSPVGSPVGYWKFDEGYGTIANNSGNQIGGLQGVLTTMASPATATSGWTQLGKFGKALNFDGTSDYVNIADNTAINFVSQPYSISAWVYKTGSGWMRMVDKTQAATANGYGFDTNDTQLRMLGSTNLTINYTLPTSTWVHVVAVSDGAGTGKIYANGVLVGSGSYASVNAWTGPLRIGADSNGGSLFTGTIDEVKVYNQALTADQVLIDMNRGSAKVLGALSGVGSTPVASQSASAEYCIPGDNTSCAAPVGRWDFEEKSGGTVNDISGNANTGTWNGTGATHWAAGKVGAAGKFNGTDDYVSIADSSSLTITSAITMEAWIKTNANTGHIIGAYNVSTPYSGYAMSIGNISNGKLSYWSGANGAWVGGNSTVNDGNWHHVAVSVSGTTATFYKDGIQDGTPSTQQPNSFSGSRSIGATSAGAGLFNGQIDQVRVFNYARNAAQVAWDYNRGAPVAYWKMDECQGDTIHDSTGNGNVGTITVGGGGTQTKVGTCTSVDTAAAWYNGRSGKYNYSLNFDGTDDYVSFANSSSLTITGPITMSAWVKTTQTTTGHIIAAYQYTSPFPGYGFAIGVTTPGKLAYWSGANGAWVESSGSAVNDGNWHHIAITESGTSLIFYVDGVSTSGTSQQPNSFSGTRSIGGRTDGNNDLNGQIDDARVYNYALTPSQVRILSNLGGVRYGPSQGSP